MGRRLAGAALLSLLIAGCAGRRIAVPAPDPPSLPCIGTAPIEWNRIDDSSQRAVLDRWCQTVGAPLLVSRFPQPEPVEQLTVVSWNVHVGGGRLKELVASIRARSPGARPAIVLLLQEAFRVGADVPEMLPIGAHIPDAIRPNRPAPDVAAVAADLGLSVAYVPSMRNGRLTSLIEREDRGAAILSTEPLNDVRAIELPYGRQRRVAVAATIALPRADETPFRVRLVSAHLDVGGSRTKQAAHLARHLEAAAADGMPIVVGADVNATFGFGDAAVKTLARVVPMEPCGTGRTAGWIARLDFMFSSLPPSVRRGCRTLTDRYGSDHRPLVLTVEVPGSNRALRGLDALLEPVRVVERHRHGASTFYGDRLAALAVRGDRCSGHGRT